MRRVLRFGLFAILYAGTNWLLRWNAPIDHPVVTALVDGPYMEQFASVFSGCCRIYCGTQAGARPGASSSRRTPRA